MPVYAVYDLSHRRAGFPSNRVSEAHITITTDHEYHLTLVSQDGAQNRYYYDDNGAFLYQTGWHANYLYYNFRQAYDTIARDAWEEYSAIAPYIA